MILKNKEKRLHPQKLFSLIETGVFHRHGEKSTGERTEQSKPVST